jgi:hypothetical protein
MTYAVGILCILLFVFSVISFLVGMQDGWKQGYERGQIDALNGKVKYHKQENEDGEIIWEKEEEPKKQSVNNPT